MKKIIPILALALSCTALQAQGLTEEILQDISSGYAGSPSDKAIRNALNTTAINVLATNAAAPVLDRHFTYEVKTKGRTDQASSGRCWLFTGLNVLRAEAIEKYDLGEFTFSQNYIFFYDQLEKANLFLQGVIDTAPLPFDDRKVDWLFSHPIGDGGQFTGVANLIMKYGLVPSEVMPETFCSNNTSQMRSLIARKLREDGLQLRAAYEGAKNPKKAGPALQELKKDMLGDIYHILAICLGVPPKEFTWTFPGSQAEASFTPRSFYDKLVGKDLENSYIMVMNDPSREYGKVYEIEYDRHVYDGQNWLYVNLPMDRIKEMAVASLKDNKAMYFSCDVGKFLNRKTGVADLEYLDYESLMGVSFGMDKKARVMTHDSGSSHAMTLIAVDLGSGDKPLKWMVENSWGASWGFGGNLIMTDDWFDNYMFRLVVEKKYVPGDILDMLSQKPVLLPSWDPMFLPEE